MTRGAVLCPNETQAMVLDIMSDGRERTCSDLMIPTGQGKMRVAKALGRLKALGLVRRQIANDVPVWRLT